MVKSAFAVGLAASAVAFAVSVPAADAAACSLPGGAAAITKLHAINCAQANMVYRTTKTIVPECKEVPTQHSNGWTIRGLGANSPIETLFSKGNKSFHLLGGGWCE
jgi:hypothetical protein